jgi:protein TonB
MEPKKSIKADLERGKFSFFLIGVVIALSFVYMTLELIGSREKLGVIFTNVAQLIEEEKIIQTALPKELPPPPPKQISQTIIEIIDDGIEVPDFTPDVEIDDGYVGVEVPYDIVPPTEIVDEPEIFTVVEELPEFPGGDEARRMFLKENLEYPRIARETGLEGKVHVGFVVEPDGRLTNFTILRGRAPSLDEEALRVAKLMPKWKAGKQRGKTVRVRYQMPITFTLY